MIETLLIVAVGLVGFFIGQAMKPRYLGASFAGSQVDKEHAIIVLEGKARYSDDGRRFRWRPYPHDYLSPDVTDTLEQLHRMGKLAVVPNMFGHWYAANEEGRKLLAELKGIDYVPAPKPRVPSEPYGNDWFPLTKT